MSFIHVMRRKRTLVTAGAVLVAAAGSGLVLTPQAKATTNGTGSTQTVTFTPTANVQLSIVASTASLSGLSSSTNPVVVTDTEADSLQWTASVQATDCFPVSTTVTGAGILPASAIQMNAGSGTLAPTTALSTTPVPATLGGTFNFQDPSTPGTATAPNLSAAQTLATAAPNAGDALSNDGVYNLNPTISINSGASGFLAVPQTYTCQLQYTVTG